MSNCEYIPSVAVRGAMRSRDALEVAETAGERSELLAQEYVPVGVVFENEGSGYGVLDHAAHVSSFGQ